MQGPTQIETADRWFCWPVTVLSVVFMDLLWQALPRYWLAEVSRPFLLAGWDGYLLCSPTPCHWWEEGRGCRKDNPLGQSPVEGGGGSHHFGCSLYASSSQWAVRLGCSSHWFPLGRQHFIPRVWGFFGQFCVKPWNCNLSGSLFMRQYYPDSSPTYAHIW